MAGEEGSGGSGGSGGGGESSDTAAGWQGRVVGEWNRIKEHAETYPYLWGSYILVYGGLGSYLAYRWRKLRKTEDRVRVLQARLRKLVEAEEASSGGSVTSSTATSSNPKPPLLDSSMKQTEKPLEVLDQLNPEARIETKG